MFGGATRTWVISSPTTGDSVVVSNFTACNDEKVLSVYVIDVPTLVGFLIIPTWENLVSIGKSFVESVSYTHLRAHET